MANNSSSNQQRKRKPTTTIVVAVGFVVAFFGWVGAVQAWSLQSSGRPSEPSPSRFTDAATTSTTTDATTTTTTTTGSTHPLFVRQDDVVVSSRRQWITQTTTATAIGSMAAILVPVTTTTTLPARAATPDDADPVAVRQAFEAVRREVLAETGGVAYLQKAVDEQNFPALLEFTKTYDQVLRKGAMGKAKQWLVSKADKEAATAAANGVTFDLIGINKSARPGQENVENARKYLQELVDDVQKFLDLEPKFAE